MDITIEGADISDVVLKDIPLIKKTGYGENRLHDFFYGLMNADLTLIYKKIEGYEETPRITIQKSGSLDTYFNIIPAGCVLDYLAAPTAQVFLETKDQKKSTTVCFTYGVNLDSGYSVFHQPEEVHKTPKKKKRRK